MEELVLHVCRQALLCMLVVSAPVSVAALSIGLAVSVAQTATQVQEQTLGYVPKLLAVSATLAVFGPWMLTQLVRLAAQAFERVPEVGSW